MKLYLSSYRLGDNPQQLVNLIGSNKKVAVIANSIDFGNDPERRMAGVQREVDDLKQLGLVPEEVDLRSFFSRPEELAKTLSEFGTIWVRGGNTFILRRAFKESGMDEWLVNQKENKELVYAGYSAGVCVLSPSLKGLETVDDPNIISDGYKKEVIWDGLGLISFAFAPHYKSNHPETKMVDREVEYYIKNGIEFKALHDGEVIIQEV
ncbi:MAG: Type 1 glutamine amidotransferase-like domain-containing protein [Candidatus Woesebacteria bacterium]|nr:MAG: Type 1 glutamine amidotransferase-like domain-containing protein [Candidatus Woesebacteria bacterium]